MAYFLPEEESLDSQGIAQVQRRKLRALFDEFLPANRFYREKLEGLSFDPLTDSLERLPFTTRAELQEDQQRHPPYGTNLSHPPKSYTRHHQTSGSTGTPIRWLDTESSWAWWQKCWGIMYRAAGVTDEDRFMFPFSFGPFVGWWGAYFGALALGNFCLPAGGMRTSARLRYLLDHEITVLCGTPTYMLRMAEVAKEEGISLENASPRALIVGGEPGGSIPATRAQLEAAWGARVFDHAGMTEMGPWGFECVEHPTGLHVVESEYIAEVVDPETGDRVPEGESGELVLTNLGRGCSPLIRYRTGDQVRLSRGQCPCGRRFARVEGGILGRVDDMLCIRGNNVFPAAIEGVLREFAEVAEFRMEVVQRNALSDLKLEIEPVSTQAGTDLAERIGHAIADRFYFQPRVVLVDPGSLPRFELKARRLVRSERG